MSNPDGMVVRELEDLPMPKRFVLSPVVDGDYQKNLPTLTAVYLGCAKAPNDEELLIIDGASLDRDPEDDQKLQLCLFTQEGDDPEDFSAAFSYEIAGTVQNIQAFWDSVMKIKRFTFAVSADNYYFECHADIDSYQITKITCNYRYLN